MQLETRHFGKLEIDEDKIIAFEEGIPGFEYIRKFIMLNTENQESPFKWLQSVDYPEYAFVLVNPYKVLEEYNINVPDSDVEMLKIESIEDVAVYCIVVVPEDITKMTANLKSPIIINTRLKKGRQVLLDGNKYSVRHCLAGKSE